MKTNEKKPTTKPDQPNSLTEMFQTLVEIVAKLRGPDGCPWDKEQTQNSLTQYAIEEAFELVEAIESGNQKDIKDELGDFLFQVILQAQVAQDHGHFDLKGVIENLSEKMIRRHPHVFSDTEAKNSEEVWRNWEKLKAQENKAKDNGAALNGPKKIFSYPRSMPALQASYKIGVKTEGYKFDWPDSKSVFEKIREEFHEVEEAHQAFLDKGGVSKPVTQSIQFAPNTARIEEGHLSNELKNLQHEIGDLLFSTAQFARHLHLEPEQCLREANRRFESRFLKVLELAGKKYGPEFQNKDQFATLTTAQMEELWAQIKSNLNATF